MANNTYDAIIIGAGIIGAVVGYELAKNGRRTLNIDMLPAAGKAMAELIEYCESGNDHDAKPMHYQLGNLDREISLGTFSRLREVNQDSTFSVLG